MALPHRPNAVNRALLVALGLGSASDPNQQMACSRIVGFLYSLGHPHAMAPSWRIRHISHPEWSAQHDVTDQGIIGKPDGCVQAVGQFFASHKFQCLDGWWAARKRRSPRRQWGALQIGPHVVRCKRRYPTGCQLERGTPGWPSSRHYTRLLLSPIRFLIGALSRRAGAEAASAVSPRLATRPSPPSPDRTAEPAPAAHVAPPADCRPPAYPPAGRRH